MEQFEAIRRDHAREGLSIRELARRHGVHRREVRQALESAVPPPKRAPQVRPAPALGAYHGVIDGWLKADREAPRKQRHTARRVWQRLRDEYGAEVSERQVARYVRACRRELGEVGEAFVPLVSEAGVEAEVDWDEATVVLGIFTSQRAAENAADDARETGLDAYVDHPPTGLPSRRSLRPERGRSRPSD